MLLRSATPATLGHCPRQAPPADSSSLRGGLTPSRISLASTGLRNRSSSSRSSTGDRRQRGGRSASSRGVRRTVQPRAELAGQYEESFADVEKRLLDFFTFKAVRVILRDHKLAKEQEEGERQEQQQQWQQPQERRPGRPHQRPLAPARTGGRGRPALPRGPTRGRSFYLANRKTEGPGEEEEDGEGALPYSETSAFRDVEWLQSFVVNNKVQDSKLFIRSLVQERQELAERIMVTRLHLYSKWAKKYDHAVMHEAIKDQNLELLRERLMETVRFQPETEDSEGKGTVA